jgi:hypothetical protein
MSFCCEIISMERPLWMGIWSGPPINGFWLTSKMEYICFEKHDGSLFEGSDSLVSIRLLWHSCLIKFRPPRFIVSHIPTAELPNWLLTVSDSFFGAKIMVIANCCMRGKKLKLGLDRVCAEDAWNVNPLSD